MANISLGRGEFWNRRRDKWETERDSLYRGTVLLVGIIFAFLSSVEAQTMQTPVPQPSVPLMQPQGTQPAGPPTVLTLADALDRAQKYEPSYLSAVTDAAVAREDRVQARAALLPSIDATTQYLGTQGNGALPSGRYVSNDGVHLYRAWSVFHQDLSADTFLRTGPRLAAAAAAIAQARQEIARRGLNVTVTERYYALVVSQRKFATAQQSLQQALRFLEITRQQENTGQAAHSDVVKAEIQYEQLKQAFDESNLAMQNARLNLAVLLSQTLDENFTVVDDLDSSQALPKFSEARRMAEDENPDLRVATETLRQANLDHTMAKTAFLPSVSLDLDYGIEANRFALKSPVAAAPEAGVLPNLGYFLTANLTLPIWHWGALRSKLHQAEYRQRQAQADLSFAQRQLLSNLYAYYNEASVARSSVDTLRHASDLAAESLRLTNLRYQAGEATALEVVDAQNTLTQARDAYDDSQVRYRVALATLQTLTGTF